MGSAVIHINLPNFQAAILPLIEPSLHDYPYVIAHPSANRPIVITPSSRAIKEGIVAGMSLSRALSRLPDLKVLPPNPHLAAKVEHSLLEIASHFTPTIQNDSQGHLYLDVSGTSRLFGPPIDCGVKVRRALLEELNLEVAVASATNKLVAKIATRTIKPEGIIEVREGEESPFLAVQDSSLLPGVGPKIGALLQIASLTTIGEIATLSDVEATTLLGRRGLALKEAALGIDPSLVDPRSLRERTLEERVDFAQSALSFDEIRGGLLRAIEGVGLSLRRENLECYSVETHLFYDDGKWCSERFNSKSPLKGDEELLEAAWRGCEKILRRGRINSIAVKLTNLAPSSGGDLFTPPLKASVEAVADSTRVRYGGAGLRRATTLFYG
ncbi:MAG: DNA polymerase Y family protein [Sphaerochaetaceae bacterium]|nr:DNA polymerase [Sphaerochaetaceae bacterium]